MTDVVVNRKDGKRLVFKDAYLQGDSSTVLVRQSPEGKTYWTTTYVAAPGTYTDVYYSNNGKDPNDGEYKEEQ